MKIYKICFPNTKPREGDLGWDDHDLTWKTARQKFRSEYPEAKWIGFRWYGWGMYNGKYNGTTPFIRPQKP